MSKHSSSKLGMLVLYSLVFTKWRVFRRQLSKLSNLVVLAACGGAAHMAAAAANSRRDGGGKKNKDSSPAYYTHILVCSAVRCSSAKQSCIGFLPSEELFLRAVHKVRQHFFREEGLKIEEKVMTDMYKVVLTWGRGCQK